MHDMSIRAHEVGATMSGHEFRDYLIAWGASPLVPVSRPDLFICQKEVSGHQETWRVIAHEPSGEITKVERVS